MKCLAKEGGVHVAPLNIATIPNTNTDLSREDFCIQQRANWEGSRLSYIFITRSANTDSITFVLNSCRSKIIWGLIGKQSNRGQIVPMNLKLYILEVLPMNMHDKESLNDYST